jgi:hypothetical protein
MLKINSRTTARVNRAALTVLVTTYALSIGTVYAGTKGMALLEENRPGLIIAYRYPDAPIPKDWRHDQDVSDQYKMLALVPKSWDWNRDGRPALMYAKAGDLTRDPRSFDAFIKESLASVKTAHPDFVSTPREAIRDQDQALWTVFDFSYTHGKTSVLETIAYRDEKPYQFTFVLRTESESDFKRYRPAFLDWIKSYKDIPEVSEPSKQSEKTLVEAKKSADKSAEEKK